jgi:hypothetical protein
LRFTKQTYEKAIGIKSSFGVEKNEEIKKQKILDEQNEEDKKNCVSDLFCFGVLNLEYDATTTVSETAIADNGPPTESNINTRLFYNGPDFSKEVENVDEIVKTTKSHSKLDIVIDNIDINKDSKTIKTSNEIIPVIDICKNIPIIEDTKVNDEVIIDRNGFGDTEDTKLNDDVNIDGNGIGDPEVGNEVTQD